MMNDKIREPYYSLMYKASIGWNEFLFQVPPELLEKYSELIIKECCIVADVAGKQDLLASSVILDYFGIEE